MDLKLLLLAMLMVISNCAESSANDDEMCNAEAAQKDLLEVQNKFEYIHLKMFFGVGENARDCSKILSHQESVPHEALVKCNKTDDFDPKTYLDKENKFLEPCDENIKVYSECVKNSKAVKCVDGKFPPLFMVQVVDSLEDKQQRLCCMIKAEVGCTSDADEKCSDGKSLKEHLATTFLGPEVVDGCKDAKFDELNEKCGGGNKSSSLKADFLLILLLPCILLLLHFFI